MEAQFKKWINCRAYNSKNIFLMICLNFFCFSEPVIYISSKKKLCRNTKDIPQSSKLSLNSSYIPILQTGLPPMRTLLLLLHFVSVKVMSCFLYYALWKYLITQLRTTVHRWLTKSDFPYCFPIFVKVFHEEKLSL